MPLPRVLRVFLVRRKMRRLRRSVRSLIVLLVQYQYVLKRNVAMLVEAMSVALAWIDADLKLNRSLEDNEEFLARHQHMYNATVAELERIQQEALAPPAVHLAVAVQNNANNAAVPPPHHNA